MTNMSETSRSWTLRASGELPRALAVIERQSALRSVSTECAGARGSNTLRSCSSRAVDGGPGNSSCDIGARGAPRPCVRRSPQIRLRLETGRVDEAVKLAREIASLAAQLAPYDDALAVSVEALVKVGLLDEAQAGVDAARSLGLDLGEVFLDEAQGRILLARGEAAKAKPILETVARTAAARGYRLVEWRMRSLAAEALAQLGQPQDAETELKIVVVAADAAGADLIADAARGLAKRYGLKLPSGIPSITSAEPEITLAGERLVTSMFADVRGYTTLTATTPPAEMADGITTLYRWAAAEVTRHHGVINKFAGDAVTATFNATGTRIDHAREALEAALALSGKAALLDLGVGIGISVGPAMVGPKTADADILVLGEATNLAARLQTAAMAGEIVLSDEAHRRVAAWLKEHGLQAMPEPLELKGFDGPQRAAPTCSRHAG